MRSIRHSLVVYFVALMTMALGAVSWTSYRTTEESLRDRQSDSQKIIEDECARRAKALYADREKRIQRQVADWEKRVQRQAADLDRRLLRQAQLMASRRLITVHYDALYPAGVITAGFLPRADLAMPLFFLEGANKDVKREMYKAYPKFTHVESSEILVARVDQDHPQEYFQTYDSKGQLLQRSESMGENKFRLSENLRKHAALLTENFDDVEFKSGHTLRRVTLKVPVSRFGTWPWRGGLQPPGQGPKGPAKGGSAPGPQPPRGFDPIKVVFIQYASDVGPLEELGPVEELGPTQAKVRELESDRDEKMAEVKTTIDQNLQQLRSRMLWISCLTLIAIWLGGYGVIRLGLAPLAKMSEAVSQVSPRNFHLPLEPAQLPQELRPIAGRLTEVLEHLQKAFAREKQAAADISHELRTPLSALLTTVEVGLRKTRTSAEYHEILTECQASGEHMLHLVERLLTLARLDAGADQYRPRAVDAIDVALQCADMIRPLAKRRGLDMRLHLPDPIALHTDPDKLREVLVNLLHNAIEYNRPDGTIELVVERINSDVRIEVRDSGIGIKPDALEHIFERFYRADPSRHANTPHAGLGLAIVKSYVDVMGGSIRVSSSDAGTTFTVELPLADSAYARSTAIQSGAPS
jgi:heavy metal sensor kinase